MAADLTTDGTTTGGTRRSPVDGSTGRRLRAALNANAVFSLLNAAVLTLAPGTIAGWLGVSIDGYLRAFGLILLGHAAILVWAARRRDDLGRWGLLNLMVIAPYPLLLLVVVGAGLVDDGSGVALVLFDAAVMALITGANLLGLRDLRRRSA